jgi:hypothetical protein
VTFARDPSRPRALRKTREAYAALAAWPPGATALDQALHSAGEISLEPSGILGEIRDDERLEAARPGGKRDVASETTFSLKKRAERPFDATRPPPFTAMTSNDDQRGETDAEKRARLEQRAAGVTLASVIDDLRIHAAVPKDKSGRWAWVAQAYFELHPEDCNRLVDRLPEFDLATKAYAIDLLVIVGHEAAQGALRRAFDDKIPAASEHALLFQRLGWLKRPTRATGEFVLDAYATAKKKGDVPVRRSAAIALGGLVHAMAASDRAAARTWDDALILDLLAMKEVKDKEVLLLALGNAALDEDALSIRMQADDAEPTIRTAVATALRRLDSDDIRATLLVLFADPNARVQRAAIASLERRKLRAADLQAMLERPGIAAENVEALTNLLAATRGAGGEVGATCDRLLDALSERTDLDPQTLARIGRVRGS